LQIGIRENEILSLSDEVMAAGFLRSVSIDWTDARLTKQLVLMGHSFGGITVFGAAKDCKHAVAIVGLDPWFFPHKEDKIGAGDH
jgi:hypothetical protein